MVLYNISSLNASNTIYDAALAVNGLTDGWLFSLSLGLFVLIAIISMKQYDTPTISVVAGLIGMVVAALFWSAGLVSIYTVVLIFLFALGAMLSLAFKE